MPVQFQVHSSNSALDPCNSKKQSFSSPEMTTLSLCCKDGTGLLDSCPTLHCPLSWGEKKRCFVKWLKANRIDRTFRVKVS